MGSVYFLKSDITFLYQISDVVMSPPPESESVHLSVVVVIQQSDQYLQQSYPAGPDPDHFKKN